MATARRLPTPGLQSSAVPRIARAGLTLVIEAVHVQAKNYALVFRSGFRLEDTFLQRFALKVVTTLSLGLGGSFTKHVGSLRAGQYDFGSVLMDCDPAPDIPPDALDRMVRNVDIKAEKLSRGLDVDDIRSAGYQAIAEAAETFDSRLSQLQTHTDRRAVYAMKRARDEEFHARGAVRPKPMAKAAPIVERSTIIDIGTAPMFRPSTEDETGPFRGMHETPRRPLTITKYALVACERELDAARSKVIDEVLLLASASVGSIRLREHTQPARAKSWLDVPEPLRYGHAFGLRQRIPTGLTASGLKDTSEAPGLRRRDEAGDTGGSATKAAGEPDRDGAGTSQYNGGARRPVSVPSSPSPERLLLAQEIRQHLRDAVDRLPLRSQHVLHLIAEEGLTQAEIGRRLDLCERTIGEDQKQALLSIEEYLEARGFDEIPRLRGVFNLYCRKSTPTPISLDFGPARWSQELERYLKHLLRGFGLPRSQRSQIERVALWFDDTLPKIEGAFTVHECNWIRFHSSHLERAAARAAARGQLRHGEGIMARFPIYQAGEWWYDKNLANHGAPREGSRFRPGQVGPDREAPRSYVTGRGTIPSWVRKAASEGEYPRVPQVRFSMWPSREPVY
jgi:RNA polymerase sigma factor (sigma-70 family)